MKKIIYSLAFIHLILIFLWIFHVLDGLYINNASFQRSVGFIRNINYSVSTYGFFAACSGMSNSVEIKVYDKEGHEKKYSTLEGFNFFLLNRDLASRFDVVIAYCKTDTLIQDLFARSVATR